MVGSLEHVWLEGVDSEMGMEMNGSYCSHLVGRAGHVPISILNSNENIPIF